MTDETETPKCRACGKPARGMVYPDTITGEPMGFECWDRENEY